MLSTVLGLLLNTHTLVAVGAYAAGAYTFPSIKAKVLALGTKAEADVKKL